MLVTVGVAVTTEPVEALKLPDGDHVYVLAPLTVAVADDPTQMVADVALTLNVGNAFTVTVVVVIELQLLDVPVTV